MMRMRLFRTFSAATISLAATCSQTFGHEAWLLTAKEIDALSRAPVPDLFTDPVVLGASALIAGVGAIVAMQFEARHRSVEDRLAAPIAAMAAKLGPPLLRSGLAIMMILGAIGGLPRAGTQPWTEPVLFVPDMQLSLLPGWDWLAPAQIVLGVLLLVGLATRAAAMAVMALVAIGMLAFGGHFLAYAPHLAAPALVLLFYGGGLLSLDRLLGLPVARQIPQATNDVFWRVIMVLVGGTFVYLGVVYKLFQPTLLIAILKHGAFPTFGLPIELIALLMTGVEIVAGLLLAMGRLVRPVAVFLIGAFTFFAVMLGETPLFHANLYAMAAMLLMAGRMAPRQLDPRTRPVLKLA